MRSVRLIPWIAIAAIGCGEPAPPPKHIQAWVESWGKMGMYLPSDDQVTFLRTNFSDVQPELAEALSHKNPDVRQRAAYVIDKIGPEAKSLGPELVRRMKAEQVRLVRIYVINALGAVDFEDDEAIDLLRARFDALSSENSPPQLLGGYADVDEKINVAAALFNLTRDSDRQQYLDFVTQWIKPLDPKLGAIQTAGYWERRWMAVIALEGMRGATAAIPPLEAMLQEPGAREWVSVHVPRVLRKLKQRSD
jgi:HEAT repeat protein